jgi:hypothetical protein
MKLRTGLFLLCLAAAPLSVRAATGATTLTFTTGGPIPTASAPAGAIVSSVYISYLSSPFINQIVLDYLGPGLPFSWNISSNLGSGHPFVPFGQQVPLPGSRWGVRIASTQPLSSATISVTFGYTYTPQLPPPSIAIVQGPTFVHYLSANGLTRYTVLLSANQPESVRLQYALGPSYSTFYDAASFGPAQGNTTYTIEVPSGTSMVVKAIATSSSGTATVSSSPFTTPLPPNATAVSCSGGGCRPASCTAGFAVVGSNCLANPTQGPGSALASAMNTRAATKDVYLVNRAQHVERFSFNTSVGWRAEDLTTSALSTSVMPGTGIVAAMNTRGNTMEVNFVGPDQHVYALWFDGSFWNNGDLTAAAGAPVAAANTSLVAAMNTVDNTKEVDYLGVDQHVHLLFFDATGWHHLDLTQQTGAQPAMLGAGLTSSMNTRANTLEIEYVGTDRHVYAIWFNGTWHVGDLTAAAGAPLAASGSALASAMNTRDNTKQVAYVGVDQHVHTLWMDTAWHDTDLSQGVLASVTGPLGATMNLIGNTLEVHFFGTDQHVHTAWFDGAWHTGDLTLAGAGPNVLQGSGLTCGPNTAGNSDEVEFVGADQRLYALWFNGSWHSGDLTAATGAGN